MSNNDRHSLAASVPTVGSMFSGYGGLDLAVEHVFGSRTVWQAEWEDAPSKVLARHWPGVPNHRDVTAVDWAAVEPVDIITGGFPCQDVSLAGRRAGLTEGTRSNLWGAMRSAIEIIRPRYVVAENVRGLLSAKAASASDVESEDGSLGAVQRRNLRALGRVLGDLADLGYDAEWCGLRASDVGAPHHRYRIFVVARSRNTAMLTWDAECPEKSPGRVQPKGSAGISDRQFGHPNIRDVAYTYGLGGVRGTDAPGEGEATGQDTSLVGADYRPGGPGAVEVDDFWQVYTEAVRRWESLHRPAPFPAEKNTRGTYGVSAKFTEWMMGLPDGWITDTPGVNRREAIKMAGNGVVPQQAIAAISHCLNNFITTEENS